MFGPDKPAQRCFRCGGFWIDSYTANGLSAQSLSMWRRITVDPMWIKGGEGRCPADGTVLVRYTGDNLPPNVVASRCTRCGKWWFPADNLFTFKPALEAKVNYFRAWGYTGDLAQIGLPILAAVILIGGIAAGVNLSRRRTQNAVPAVGEISRVAVSYVGEGEAVAVFWNSGPAVVNVSYQETGSQLWQQASVGCQEQLCQARLVNLVQGAGYEVQIAGEVYTFVAK